MENKTILQFIKNELNELQILVADLENAEYAEQLLIDITTAKAKTLLQEFSLLKSDKKITEPIITIFNEEPEAELDAIIEDVYQSQPVIEELIADEIIIQPAVVELVKEEETAEITPQITLPEPVIVAEVKPAIPEEVSEFATQHITKTMEINHTETITIEEVKVTEPEWSSITKENIIEAYHIETQSTLLIEPEHGLNEKKVFGEQFSKEPSLNDKLSSAKNTESKIKAKPITSIKAAIGLNDRFLFTRELFGNVAAKFESTVETLDSVNSIVEAVEFLEQNFKWQKNDTSLKFLDLVKRRFEK